MAAFTGLLASMVVVLGRLIMAVPRAFVAVRIPKWKIIVVFATGLAI